MQPNTKHMNDTEIYDAEYERYKDWDFSKATQAKHPAVLELQARKREHDRKLNNFFDKDVLENIMEHDNDHDRERANTVLRALFATA